MKRIFKTITIIVLGLLSSTSCLQQLEISQKSVLSTEDYYRTAGPEQAEKLIAAVYKSFYYNLYQESALLFLDFLGDDLLTGGSNFGEDSNNIRAASDFNVANTDFSIVQSYANFYRIMYYCNMILERVPESSDPHIIKVKAEAEFLRALVTFESVRWYGTPPFVTKVLTDKEDRVMANGDTKEMIRWAMDRMYIAADILEPLSGQGQQEAYGARASKHTVLAYIGKIGVWYGQKFNDQAILKEGLDALQKVIDSNLYDLVEDPSVIGRKAGDFCKEYVFEHNCGDDDGYPRNQATIYGQFVSWRMENFYIPSHITKGWGWGNPSKSFGDFLVAHDGVDSPRFKSTLVTYDQLMAYADYPEVLNKETGKMEKMKGVFKTLTDHAGYFRNRYVLYTDDIYTNIAGGTKYSMANSAFMRYAEVLLLYAEAKFLIDNDSDGKGLQALNKVRIRAGIEPLSTMTYQDIKDERRAELWCEQERYFDLVRWGDAAEVLKDKGKVRYSFNGYKPGTTEWDVIEEPGPGKGWSDKYNLLPFSQAQLSANPLLKQNPGW